MLVLLKGMGTFVMGSLMIVTLFVLGDKGLTPFPQPAADVPLETRLLRRDKADLTADCERYRERIAALEADNAVLKMNVEALIKVAVWVPGPRPQAGPEVNPADLIPPQQIPVPGRD